MRTNVEVDRLSNLPDDLIRHILSFISFKCAIHASFLSRRWRFVWTTMPYLNFSSEDFPTLPGFSKFVSNVLSRRNNQIEVSSVKLSFRGQVSQAFVKRIMKYAFSHNVQQLTLTCLNEEKCQFPPSIFTSQSLKHLTLTNSWVNYSITPKSTSDLSALTTLHVSHVNWWVITSDKWLGLFSTCVNLKNLTFKQLCVMSPGVFSICHPRLSNLTLENVISHGKVFDVVAPQLESLTIKDCSMKFRISAPGLSSFHYEGNRPRQFCTNGFDSLEKANLCFRRLHKEDTYIIISLLQQVHSAKFLGLNSEMVELLSFAAVELLSHLPSPFANLKCLKIYPLDLNEELDKNVTMSTEVRNYFLENSPSAIITMVSRKEIKAPKNANLAQKLMEELQVELEQRKANSDPDKAHMERGKAPMHMQGGWTAQINSYWEALRVQIEQGKAETRGILSKLSQIEGLLAKLPARDRAEMHPMFSRVCADVDIFVNDIIDRKKIYCDNKRRRLNAYFYEVATTSRLSS